MNRLHPGRELIRCAVHSHSFYPRAAGCSICRMARRAEQLAAGSREPHLVTDLIDHESALTGRAIDRANATIASIDATLGEHTARHETEQQRAQRHEQRVAELGRGLFEAMCGAGS